MGFSLHDIKNMTSNRLLHFVTAYNDMASPSDAQDGLDFRNATQSDIQSMLA